MSKAKKRHTRKRRHQLRQALNNGKRAKPTHKLKTGRTGAVHHKRNPSKQSISFTVTIEWSVPVWAGFYTIPGQKGEL